MKKTILISAILLSAFVNISPADFCTATVPRAATLAAQIEYMLRSGLKPLSKDERQLLASSCNGDVNEIAQTLKQIIEARESR